MNVDSSWTAPTINLNSGEGSDLIRVNLTASAGALATVNVDTDFGDDEVQVWGVLAGDTLNVDTGLFSDNLVIGANATAANFNTGIGTLAAIQGTVNATDSGVASILIDDSGDATGRTFTATAGVPNFGGSGLVVDSAHFGVINLTSFFEVFEFAAGSGADTLNVDATLDGFNTVDSTFFGNAGNDTFNINSEGLRDRNFFNGGDPTTGGDTVIINGTTGDDDINVELTGPDSAEVTVNGLPAITIDTIELLIIDGVGGDDDLTVNDTADADRWVHTPGNALDAGRVQATDLNDSNGTLLPVEYVHLGPNDGTVTIDAGDDDTIMFVGTDASDTDAELLLSDEQAEFHLENSVLGSHITVSGLNADDIEVDLLEGDDRLEIDIEDDADHQGVSVRMGGPGGSDHVEFDLGDDVFNVEISPESGADGPVDVDITNAGLLDLDFDIFGAELIAVDGESGNDDTLRVVPGSGDHTARIADSGLPGSGRDLLTSDTLPDIVFEDLDTFIFSDDNDNGFIDLTVQTADLDSADTYQIDLGESDRVTIEGSSLDDVFRLFINGNGNIEVERLNGSGGFPDTFEFVGAPDEIRFATLGGDDILEVDVDGTDLITPLITYDGGDGADLLTVGGDPTPVVEEVRYIPGAEITSGRLEYYVAGDVEMAIGFTNLEPVIDAVVADKLTVLGTNADNAINYQDGGNGLGVVTVDGFEAIAFINKTELEIDALAGDDTINLNNPNTPTGLTTITVNGDDPTASDTLIANGIAGSSDILLHSPTGVGAGTILNQGPAQPTVTFSGIEHLELVGQEADGDVVRVNGTTGDDHFEYTPGSTADSGVITGVMDNNGAGAGPFTLTETRYRGVSNEVLGVAVNANIGGNAMGGTDSLVFNGTAGDDAIDVTAIASTGAQIDNTIGTNRISRIFAIATDSIIIRGHDGSDVFNHAGDVGIPISYEGGNPSAGGDELNFQGSGAGAITIDLDAETITEAGFGDASFSGVEIVTVDAAGQNVSFDGTTSDDQITVSPTGTDSVVVRVAGVNTVFEISDIGDFDVDGVDGDDTLTVNGTSDGETIDVTGTNVAVGSLEDVVFANIDVLEILARDGDDTINVMSSAVPVSVKGGNPIGRLQQQSVGDILNVETGGSSFTFLPGPEPDSGTVAVSGDGAVSFDEIELLQVDGENHILPDRFDDPNLVAAGNDNIATATNLGSEPTVIERELNLHDERPINPDWFKITAHETGKMIFNVFFSHAFGNIDIEVVDMDGDRVAISESFTDNEQIVIPVVGQEMYFLRVFAGGAQPKPNNYNLEIENFAAPVPNPVDFDEANPKGMFDDEDLTSDATPRFTIQADLQDFADMGIDILTAAQAEANLADPNANPFPGAAVEIQIVHSETGQVHGAPIGGLEISGFADAIGTSNTRFEFEPSTLLLDGEYFVTAAVRVFDNQNTPSETGRARLSEPRSLTILANFSIASNYWVNGAGASVQQSGNDLTFTNENGDTSAGVFVSPTKVIATDWGDLCGNITPQGIDWANGTFWSTPTVQGDYTFNGQPTHIQQHAGGLQFINESGGTSSGCFQSPTEVVAREWGNLVGTINGNQINWSNGSTWTTNSIAGTYSFGGQPTMIEQQGTGLVLHNENGDTSAGYFIGPSQIVATDWGNLVGTVNGSQIDWDNGSSWSTPNIAGDYTSSGQPTKVDQFGAGLVFTNEAGMTSRGHFISPTEVVAIDWGNLGGTLVGGEIHWNNGTTWQ